jgi:hypothetical protein
VLSNFVVVPLAASEKDGSAGLGVNCYADASSVQPLNVAANDFVAPAHLSGEQPYPVHNA